MAIYPTEEIIWDENLIPYDTYHGGKVLALNKLNLQFLTLHDYLLRNFHLFRLESTCVYIKILYKLKYFELIIII